MTVNEYNFLILSDVLRRYEAEKKLASKPVVNGKGRKVKHVTVCGALANHYPTTR